MSEKLGSASAATLDPLMRVVFEAVQGAERAGASVWDGLAVYSAASCGGLDSEGLKRAVQAQIEAAAPMMPADWTPNTNSTFRVYRKLIVDARKYGVDVTIVDEDGVHLARSVAEVREAVKSAKADEKAAEGGGEAEGAKGEDAARLFDALPPDERITAAIGFIRTAYGELATLEAKAAARDAIRALAAEVGC